MNYVHHAIIGVGTASLGVVALEALGMPPLPATSLGLSILAAALGAIATDLDHPKSFISNSIPTKLIRTTLMVLAIPLIIALGTFLITRDVQGTVKQFSAMVWGILFLRWAAVALMVALGLMGISRLLYKGLHHRGPLHSLLFALAMTIAACLAFQNLSTSWAFGLFFGWGWLWHILADGLTTEGVPFFWPINDNRLHTLPHWTLGVAKVLLTFSALVGIGLLVYWRISPFFG